MADRKKEQERDELFRRICKIAILQLCVKGGISSCGKTN